MTIDLLTCLVCKTGQFESTVDPDAARPRLRAAPRGAGFRHHSDRQVGPYYGSRYEIRVSWRFSRSGKKMNIARPSGFDPLPSPVNGRYRATCLESNLLVGPWSRGDRAVQLLG